MKMTAVKMGFYNNSMVRPGAHFEFDESSFHRPPKWAVPFGTPVPEKNTNPDTKPPVTMAAVREKAERWAAAGFFDSKPPEAQLAAYRTAGTYPSDHLA